MLNMGSHRQCCYSLVVDTNVQWSEKLRNALLILGGSPAPDREEVDDDEFLWDVMSSLWLASEGIVAGGEPGSAFSMSMGKGGSSLVSWPMLRPLLGLTWRYSSCAASSELIICRTSHIKLCVTLMRQ